jgi:hypothetical protein
MVELAVNGLKRKNGFFIENVKYSTVPKDIKYRKVLFEIYTKAKNLPPQNSIEEFQKLTFDGIPEEYRGISWKLLLKILPFEDRSQWNLIQERMRHDYSLLLKKYLKDPTKQELDQIERQKISLNYEFIESFEISSTPTKKLDFKPKDMDVDMLLQIERDMKRTFLDLSFFQNQAPRLGSGCIWKWTRVYHDSQDGSRHRILNEDGERIGETHWEVIERMLYIFSKVNPIKYVQGMNHIIAPLYYVLANQPDADGIIMNNNRECRIRLFLHVY